MKALILSVAATLLIASAVQAQTQHRHWYSVLGRFIGIKPKATPAPPMIVPRLPLQAAPGIRVYAALPLDRDFRLFGTWPPLWIGDQEVAIFGRRGEHTVLSAFFGDRFQKLATLLDQPQGQLLDLAVSSDGRHLATVSNRGDHLEVELLDPAGLAPPMPVGEIGGKYQQASLVWVDGQTLAAGAEGSNPAQDGEQPRQDDQSSQSDGARQALYLFSTLRAYEPRAVTLQCLAEINPAQLRWSPDRKLAVAPAVGGSTWYLVDRLRGTCTPVRLGRMNPVNFLEWSPHSRRFLFTVVPKSMPAPFALGVAEYRVDGGVVTILAAPAASAVYLDDLGEVVLGSRSITAQSLRANPAVLAPAEIGWFTATHMQLKIVPLGVRVQGGELLNGRMSYCAANGLVAINLPAPGPDGEFPALLWLAASLRNGGVLAYGETHGFLSASWSPDGSKIALLGGRPDTPTAAVFEAPHH